MKKGLYLLICLMLIILCACDSSISYMQFSFNTGVPANSSDAKAIYINQDIEKLNLNAALKIDSGSAAIQVVDAISNQVLWSNSYDKDANFQIELKEVKADCEFRLEIQATESKNVQLTITSDTKLAKDIEKPDKKTPEKFYVG